MHDGRADWGQIKQTITVGTRVTGIVVARSFVGVFVDIGVGITALLNTQDFASDLCGYPRIGETLTAVVSAFDDDRRRIRLTQKN